MDHAEALEILELAAVEPGGIDRLAAGDTPEAAAVAGHLAGCHTCAAELERLRRASAVLRDVIRTTPPRHLRDRTLSYVAAVGREPRLSPAAVTGPPAPAARRDRARPSWPALAAVVLVSVLASGALVGGLALRALGGADAEFARQNQVVQALSAVTTGSLRVGGLDDARTVRLSSTSGGDGTATIVYSPSSGELVVVAEGIEEPPAGSELRCWVEVDGARKPVGRMFFGGGISYWVGDVEAVTGLTGEATFGISLAQPEGAEPILSGDL